jgi:hypothetical protein
MFTVLAAWLLAGAAHAGVVGPGESRHGTREDHNVFPVPPAAQWQGELLAERSEAFEFVGEPPEGGGEAPFARGTFTSRVHRDLEGGGLAFVYVLDQTESSSVIDLERVTIRSFGSFTTDVYFSEQDHGVTRSADGAALDYLFNIEDVSGTFLVRTNAAAFDENGSFLVGMDFEPSGVTRNDTFAAFQPVADDNGGQPNPIPLPPAAWAGLATAGAFGAIGRLRRRR